MHKFCVDCKYHMEVHYRDRCAKQPDLVTGKPDAGWRGSCSSQRADDWVEARLTRTCGKEGRWFEAK